MHPRVILSVSNFFFSLATGLTVYVLIPFLSRHIGATYAGLVISLGGALAILSFIYLPSLVSRYGAQGVLIVGATAQMIALVALAAVPGAVAAVLFGMLMIALQPLIAYEFDLLLEATTTETGTVAEVRTAFITAYNIGVCAAPLLLGAILSGSDEYGKVFLTAAAALVPIIVLFTARNLPTGVPPHLSHLRDTFLKVVRDRDLGAITFAHMILYLFAVWAPFYVPLYLHDVVGIPWSTLGWMFTLMLVPYVLIEYPAGWLADRFWGDKELLVVGFIIAGGALVTIGLLPLTTSLFVILMVLITSRIGAALIESMTEGHFFRRVSQDDIGSMSFFRGVWPLASIIGPIIGSLILSFGNFSLLFILTGAFVIIAGTISALLITDFK